MVHDINTEDYSFELPVFSDKLVHLCPVNHGWSLIGRTDKFLSPATVMEPVFTRKQMSFQVKEAGQVAFYMDNGVPNAGCLNRSSKEAQFPNVVFILTDDMGYGDISFLYCCNPFVTASLIQMHKFNFRNIFG